MNNSQILKVDLGERSYDIVIGDELLSSSGENILNATSDTSQYIIVTDENIPDEYVSKLQKLLSGDDVSISNSVIKLKAGEGRKSFRGVEYLLDKIFEHNPDRKTTLIALGGGVIGDITGFAASILLRGVRFIQVPTTLLAQVDSSVGGKTGVNNKFGKNLIGSFYQPKLVLADTDILRKLPEREFLSGYAEVVKYGLINDAEFFDWLGDNLDKILAKDAEALQYIIKKSCQSKADIVAKDEREGGVRALLNLGHTFGHAIELQAGYSDILRHGEAVSIGMVFAFELSNKMGLCSEDDIKKVKEHLSKAKLPISLKDVEKDSWDVDALMKAMAGDKKASNGKMVFILANAIGDSFIEKNIDESIVRELVESFVGA